MFGYSQNEVCIEVIDIYFKHSYMDVKMHNN